MTNPRPPAAVAAGDQMHARVLDLAEQLLTQALTELANEEGQRWGEILTPAPLDEDERAGFDLGVQCGMRATLTAAIEFGWLKGSDQ